MPAFRRVSVDDADAKRRGGSMVLVGRRHPGLPIAAAAPGVAHRVLCCDAPPRVVICRAFGPFRTQFPGFPSLTTTSRLHTAAGPSLPADVGKQETTNHV